MKNKYFLIGFATGSLTFVLLLMLVYKNFTNKFYETNKLVPITFIKYRDMNNIEKSLLDSNKGRIFVNFWATWCVPCIKEIPMINNLSKGSANKYFLLTEDKEDKVKKFVSEKNLGGNIEFGIIAEMDKKIELSSIPYSFIVNENDSIIWSKLGSLNESDVIKITELME